MSAVDWFEVSRRGIDHRGWSLEERFWSYVERGDGCWLWSGSRQHKGYGLFWTGERTARSHRVSWALAHGPIPAGLCVLHHCDNPPCVRPDHLFLGTDRDNAHDKIRKQRAATPPRFAGETHPRVKLTANRVREIRGRYPAESQYQLAIAFGMSRRAIQQIVNRQRWRDLDA